VRALYIEWLDASSLTGGVWHSNEDAKDLEVITVTSVGFVVAETKDSITLAPHISTDEVCGDLCIPKCAIKKKRILKTGARG